MRIRLKTTLLATRPQRLSKLMLAMAGVACSVLLATFALAAPLAAFAAPPAPTTVTNPFDKGKGILKDTGIAAYGTEPTVGLAGTVGAFINAALALLGIIFLVLMVYAGFRWMTAQGEAEVVQKSKDIITAAVIGLAIVLAAYAITNFVVTRLINASKGTQSPPVEAATN